MAEYRTVRSVNGGRVVHAAPVITRERLRDFRDKVTWCLPLGRLGVRFEDCEGPVTCVSCINVRKRSERSEDE